MTWDEWWKEKVGDLEKAADFLGSRMNASVARAVSERYDVVVSPHYHYVLGRIGVAIEECFGSVTVDATMLSKDQMGLFQSRKQLEKDGFRVEEIKKGKWKIVWIREGL